MWQRIQNEPALVAAIIRQGIALLAAFGFSLTAEQTVALGVFIEAISTLFTRQSVTPNQLAEYRVDMGGRPSVPMSDAQNAPRRP